MSFGLTVDGFKIKRLADVKAEIQQRFRDEFGDNIDLSDETPEGQMIAIFAERESLLWELAQNVYNSQYPIPAEGRSLDNVVAITGTTRREAQFSRVVDGVARGTNGTVVPAGTIISVQGNSSARFIVQQDTTINIVDGATFKSGPIELIAETAGPVLANTGTLNVIETPVAGMDSFTNESDAEIGANIETDAELKSRRDQELQLAGSATVEAILSELRARELVEAVIVFQNIYSIPDLEGRPPHSLDIVVLGDDEDDLAEAIFLVVGAGIETIGSISRTVVDSQGFSHTIKFSRPTEVNIWLELDLTVDINLYPVDGDDQVEEAILLYAEDLTVGEDVVIYGTKSLIAALTEIPGILDVVTRIGKTNTPTLDDNIVIAAREIAKFDSARITVNS
jgi:uncharacterized phage protein gp47/JayE